MNQPKGAKRRSFVYQFTLDDEEAAGLERLLAARRTELDGAELSQPQLVRWLIARELRARGLITEPTSTPPMRSRKR